VSGSPCPGFIPTGGNRLRRGKGDPSGARRVHPTSRAPVHGGEENTLVRSDSTATLDRAGTLWEALPIAARSWQPGIVMPTLIAAPSRVTAAGNKPKRIDEYVGRVNNREARLSIAHMRSPSGWVEPGQRPEFDEYTLVLAGTLALESEDGSRLEVSTGQAVLVRAGEWVRYSTPGSLGAEYIAVCLPAFAPDLVHRDA
jgi:mannose-6-phosphate isomerase-like protein (cupin superfamily)